MNATKIQSWSFFLLASLVLAGPSPLTKSAKLVSEDDGGDPLRQLIIIGLIFCSVALPFLLNNRTALQLPKSVWVFFVWAAITITWSEVPDIAIRRYIMTVGATMAIFSACEVLGPKKMLTLLTNIVFMFVVFDILAVMFVSSAVHDATETDRALIGLWKGIHAHKNMASSVAFFGLILSITQYNRENAFRYFIMLLLSFILLLGSASKTVLLLFPLSLAAVVVMNHTSKTQILRSIVSFFFFIIVIAAIFLVSINIEEILKFLSDPLTLTGRGALWGVMLSYVQDNPYGAGYASFWNVGFKTPALAYAPFTIALAPHGHNGYLELLATTGYVGFTLGIWAAVILPCIQILSQQKLNKNGFLFCIATIMYFAIQNFTESSMFAGTRPDWVFLIVALSILKYNENRSEITQESRDILTGIKA